MKTENLEALLIDRALVELPLATAELLDEYLSSNPAAAAKAQEFTGTLRLACEATRATRLREPRPFPKEAIARAQQVVRWRHRALQTMKFAACVALGLSLGWFGKPSREAGAPGAGALPNPQHRLTATEKKTEPAVGFWSLARFEAQRKAPSANNHLDRYQLRLESSLNPQKLEEKL